MFSSLTLIVFLSPMYLTNWNCLIIKLIFKELSRGKEAALEQDRLRLETERKRELARELEIQEQEYRKKIQEVEKEGNLAREELELRLAASENSSQLKNLESELSKIQNENLSLNEKIKLCSADQSSLREVEKQMSLKESRILQLDNQLNLLEKSTTESIQLKDSKIKENFESLLRLEEKEKSLIAQIESLQAMLEVAQTEKQNMDALHQSNAMEIENEDSNLLNEEYRLEIEEKNRDIARISEVTKELQTRLDYNLESSMKTEEELELRIKKLEEQIQSKDEELHDFDDKFNSKVLELRDANEELEEFKIIADERGITKVDLEKELQSLKEQVNSRQALHDQMVNYEKELHNRISTLETEKSTRDEELGILLDRVKVLENEKITMIKKNEEEILQLKHDMEMKVQLERERENSHKEFQKQSIEYEKKLQDQLVEKNHLIDSLQANVKNYVKKNESLENEINDLMKSSSEKSDELQIMFEKCENHENLLKEREKHLSEIGDSFDELSNQVAVLQNENSDLRDNRKQLNEIISESKTNCENMKDQVTILDELRNENTKLSKSRDRLKSILDEKNKAFVILQEENQILSGSQEKSEEKMREEISSIQAEILRSELTNEKLLNEFDHFKSLTSDKEKQLTSKLDEITQNNLNLRSERDRIEAEKCQANCELDLLKENLESTRNEIQGLQSSCENLSKLEIELADVKSKLKASTEEIGGLKESLDSVNGLSDYSELKEENALLTERINQCHEEKHFIEKRCAESWQSRLETSEKFHAIEIAKLQKSITDYEHTIDDLKSRHMTEETEDKIKSLVKNFERKISIMNAENQEELDNMQEKYEIEIAQVQKEHKDLIRRLNEDLRGKVEHIEQMDLKHLNSMQILREEMAEELEMREEKQRQALAELSSSQERSGWGDWGDQAEAEHLCDDSPAIFGVPDNTPHPADRTQESAVQQQKQSLEDNPEFEYLRNILYEYMLGRQPLILAKVESTAGHLFGFKPVLYTRFQVLSAIVKFSPAQVSEIVSAEERKQSYLASLGLS